jgi:hypothetical protein
MPCNATEDHSQIWPQYSATSAVRNLPQMAVLQNVPREGGISAKEEASEVGKNEEVLGQFLEVSHVRS